jgi:hypothetical protein
MDNEKKRRNREIGKAKKGTGRRVVIYKNGYSRRKQLQRNEEMSSRTEATSVIAVSTNRGFT